MKKNKKKEKKHSKNANYIDNESYDSIKDNIEETI